MNLHKLLIGLVALSSLAMSGTAFSKEKIPAELKGYTQWDAAATQAFQQMSDSSWEQLKSIPNPMLDRFPNAIKHLTWKKALRIGLEPLKHNRAQFMFASPTWTNVEGLTSGGGGYSPYTLLPVQKYGVQKLQDGRYEFMIYARFLGTDPMELEIIQPYVIAANEYSAVEAARASDPTCNKEILRWDSTYGCTTATKKFDYVLLRFNPSTPDQLELIGKNFRVAQPVFSIDFQRAP